MIIITNLIEVAEMHKELLNLSIEDTFEFYSIFCTEMGANLLTLDDMIFVYEDIFLYNYSKCFFIFLNYLLEKNMMSKIRKDLALIARSFLISILI